MFSYYRSVTVDHTKCGATNSTNFPMAFFGTYAGGGGALDLRSTGNGGQVAQANGYDIAFYADSGLTTLLNFERVSWTAATGAVEFWIQIPTLDSASDTIIYIAYGDSGASDLQNADATWRSEFKAVWHMQEASGDVADSSGNSHTATNNASSSITGKIGKARNFNAGTEYMTSTNHADWEFGSSDFTIIYWCRSVNFDDFGGYVNRVGTTTFSPFFTMYGRSDLYMTSNGTSWDIASGKDYGVVNNDTWYRAALVRIGTSFYTYLNAAQGATWTNSSSLWASTADLAINRGQGSSPRSDLDEIWIIKGLGLTPDWLTADHNNQNAPSTFYTLGSETAVPTTGNNTFKALTGTGTH